MATVSLFVLYVCFLIDDQGLSYATPEVPTDANFDSLFRQFVRFFFSTSEGKAVTTQADPTLSAGYRVTFLSLFI